MKRAVTSHAFRRMKERCHERDDFASITDFKAWINKSVPPGEGRVEHEGYTFVFSPVRPSGKQDLITMWRTPCSLSRS